MRRRRIMPIIDTYYLIDFENVNDAGLVCSNPLTPHDHIHLFFTKTTPKIGIENLSFFNDAVVYFHNTPAGNQSLDKHLVAYLGYLIGKNNSQSSKYIIVSNDTGYDNIISFFKEWSSAKITRQPQIDCRPQKPTITKTLSTSNQQQLSPSKQQLNNKIQKALSNAGYNNQTISWVASLSCKHFNEKNNKQTIYRAIIAKYHQKDGLTIYNHIKKHL